MHNAFKGFSYFATINGFLAILCSFRYFESLPELSGDLLGISFLISSVFSQMLLLTLVVSLPLLVFLWLPKRWFMIIAAIYFTCYLSGLYIDTIVFSQYKFHINPAMLELILAGGIVDFSMSTWIMAGVVVLILVAAQSALFTLSSVSWGFKRHNPLKKLALLFVIMLTSSNLLYIWGAANVYQPITSIQPFLPAFYPITANGFMNRRGWIDQEKLEQQRMLARKKSSTIHYPKQVIETTTVDQPVNIMFLLIDSWRFDSMNQDNTPHIWEVAQQGIVFNQHRSSGNSTRAGIFGFFYGLHGTYWNNIINNVIPPIFITRLQELDYQLGIFAAAQLYRPELNNTVFATVPNLRLESDGSTPSARDRDAVDDWIEWYSNQDADTPMFSFLFLDSAHGYDIPKNMERKYIPESNVNYIDLTKDSNRTPVLNRYKNSVYYIDDLIGEVIEKLKATGQLDNTLLIITGDHGQEVNDTKQNNWGHNSNFTDFQIKIPMIISGPGTERFQALAASNAITHHTDIVPTLLKNYLGVQNPVEDFASGVDWLDFPSERSWVLASSYNKFALVTKELVFEIDPQGRSELVDQYDRPIKGKNFPAEYIRKALDEISYFNR